MAQSMREAFQFHRTAQTPSPQECPGCSLLSCGMKFTRVRSKASALHVSVLSPGHKRDKAQGDERRQFKYVAVKSSLRPGGVRTYPGVAAFEAIASEEGAKWTPCKGVDELGQHLDRERLARRRYYAPVNRRGRVELMARIDATPVTVHTISFSPAQCDLISDLNAKGEGHDLPRKILAQFVKMAMPLLAGKRVPLGIALHQDTGTLHCDLALTRHTSNGRIGKAGLGLIGPHGCAVDRQIRSGAIISRAKRAEHESALANLRRRPGAEEVPFDIALARAFDDAAAKVLGSQLAPYVARYADSVPAMEREQLLATLAEVEAVRVKLIEDLNETSPELLTHPLPQPTAEVFDRSTGAAGEGSAALFKVVPPPGVAATPATGWAAHYQSVV
jgi:hypothetical protein